MPTRKRIEDEDESEDLSLEALEKDQDLEDGEPQSPPEEEPPTLLEGWDWIESAPQNGRVVLLCGLLEGFPLYTPGYVYHSRRWGGSALRWVPFSEWRIFQTPHKVPFEPLVWTRFE